MGGASRPLVTTTALDDHPLSFQLNQSKNMRGDDDKCNDNDKIETNILNPFEQQSQSKQQQQQQQEFIPSHLENRLPVSLPVPLSHQHPILRPNGMRNIPVYNGVNPEYPGLRVVNQNPPIFAVDNFLTPAECDFLIYAAQDSLGPAPVVGKGSGEVSSSRSSSTCYLAREDLPGYIRKVTLLTGKPFQHCELPQVGRYLPTQQYLQHFDAFDLSSEDGRRFASNGGQRTITILVYLNDVSTGGNTVFPRLNIQVQPRRGMALVFFPATVDGTLDKMTLHAALPAVDVKYVSQVWIRQTNYDGVPSKRLFINNTNNNNHQQQSPLLQQQQSPFENSITSTTSHQGGIPSPSNIQPHLNHS
uniref:Fe2OG dioxygenase domain-containing protein n=1 Tax=Eucampia antarctica TaxID=49252 RepID=A0A6U0TVS1_9STRA|mmetsp:Transcript_9030/g.8616  ORF Transcript_9030/g.8616 Transcript_9030/m.8616 type:complete len:360 (+) Transcript_9030:33-1112(+)